MPRTLALAVLALTLLATRAALACSPLSAPPYVIDRSSKDRQPPTRPTLAEPVRVERGRAGDGGGCGELAAISLEARSTDDQSEPWQLGYRVSLVKGTMPDPHALPRGVVGLPVVTWFESARDLPPLELTLSIVAVDRAGNESQPLLVQVTDAGFATPRPIPAHAAAACQRRDAAACTWLAKQARHGRRHDVTGALALYHKACALGDGLACEILAADRACPPDAASTALEDRATAAFTASCAGNDGVACNDLAWHLERRQGAGAQIKHALLRSCELGVARSCWQVTRWFDLTVAEAAQDEAGLEGLCQQGDVAACFARGQGSEDPADSWLTRACALGSAYGCVALADLAMTVDVKGAASAAQAYRQACRATADTWLCRKATAIAQLADGSRPFDQVVADLERDHLLDGPLAVQLALRLAKAEPRRAARYRRRACDDGQAASCAWLAQRSTTPAQAIAILADSSESGHTTSCALMARSCNALGRTRRSAAWQKCIGDPAEEVTGLNGPAFHAGCDAGSRELCVRAAREDRRLGDLAEARRAEQQACALGDRRVCAAIAGQAPLTGRIVDASGAGAPGLYLELRRSAAPDGLCDRHGRTDAQGAFTLADACPGSGVLRAARDRRMRVVLAVAAVTNPSSGAALVVSTIATRVPPAAEHGITGIGLGSELTVRAVVAGSPAARAGLTVGDQIISVDGHRCGADAFAADILFDYLNRVHIGQTIVLVVTHDGATVTRSVTAVAPD
jgi:TPR repeat protein